MGFKNYLVLQLIILLFLPSISKATQPVRNAYSNVVVNVCQPSDSNSNCGGGGGGGSTTPGGTQGNVQFLDVVGTVKTFQGNNGFQYTGVGSTPGNVGIGTVSPQGLLQISGITNVGINSVAPAQLLDVNGSVKVSGSIYGGDTPTDISPLDVAGLSLQDSKNERYGITVKTTNTTTASVADARIAISDQTGDYVSMNHPATTATVQTLFGKPRSGGDFIFNNSATNNRYLLLGTFGNAPVLFGTNNSEKARFSADGNLGIGNQTPGMKLDVSGSVQMTGFSLTTNPSSGYVLTSNGVGIGTWSPASGGGSSQWTTTGSNIYYNTGNVGVGTITPLAPFDINSTDSSAGALLFNANNSSQAVSFDVKTYTAGIAMEANAIGSGKGAYMNVTGNYEGWFNMVALSNSSGNKVWRMGTGSSPTSSGFAFQKLTDDETGISSTPFLIKTDGNIGINNTSPAQKLDVTGVINATSFSGAGTGLTGTASSLTAGTVTTNANLTGAVTSSGNVTSNNFTANIGIGSASPGAQLDVNGTVRMTGFTMKNSVTNGYVLTTDANGNGTWQAVAGSGTINSGTINRMAKYTGSTTISSSSVMTDDGTNIGIGSVNPVALLDISGTVSTYFGTNVGIGSLSPGVTLDVQGSVRILGTPNVSIGTRDATRTLVVSGNNGNAVEGNVMAITTGQGTAGSINGNQLNITNGPGGATAGLEIGFDPTGVSVTGVHGPNYAYLNNVQNAPFLLGTSNLPRFLIDGSGNVGIGSLSPGKALDINGTVRIYGGGNLGIGTTTGPNQALDVVGNGTFSGGTQTRGLPNFTHGAGVETFYNSASNLGEVLAYDRDASGYKDLVLAGLTDQFYTSGVEVARITGNNLGIGTTAPKGQLIIWPGNVGIGTNVPGQALDIKGTVRATGYYAGTTAGFNGTCGTTSVSTITVINGIITACTGV